MQGFWFMVEASIAGVILVSVVAFLSFSNLNYQKQDITTEAYRILNGLKRQDILAQDAFDGNYTAINNRVRFFAFNHSVQICTPEKCIGDQPDGNNIWVGSYITSGKGIYHPQEVKLYIFDT